MSTSLYLVTVDDTTGLVVSAMRVGASGELSEVPVASGTTLHGPASVVLNFYVSHGQGVTLSPSQAAGTAPVQTMGLSPHQNMGPHPQQNMGPHPQQNMGPHPQQNMGPHPQQNMGPHPQQNMGPHPDNTVSQVKEQAAPPQGKGRSRRKKG